MTSADKNQEKKTAILQQAEQRLRAQSDAVSAGEKEANTANLIRELHIYQARLEIQNEELRQAQARLEDVRTKYTDLYDFAPVGYVVINNTSLILEANLTLAKMLDMSRGKLQQQMLRRFVYEADQDAYYFFHRGLFHEQSTQRTQLRLYRQDGTVFYVLLEGVLATSEAASMPQARITISDISEQAHLQDSVERKTDELIVTEAALEATSEAHTRVQVEVEQRKRVEAELRFLLKLIETVNAATGFEEALRVVLEAMCIQEDRIYGEVWLPNKERTFLTLSPVFHLQEPDNGAIRQFRQTGKALTIAPGEGIAGQAWESGELVWVEDAAALPAKPHSRRKAQVGAGLHALLAVPITADDDMVAVLLLYKNVPNKRNDRFLALAAAAATQLGFVLKEKRGEMLLQQAHDELEARVAERTSELHQTNVALEALVREREAAEERLQQRNQELELLHRFSQFISGTLDITQVLQSFAALLQEELHIPGGFVFFYDRGRQQIHPQLSWGLTPEQAKVMMSWPLEENPLFQEAAQGEMILHRHLRDVPFFLEQEVSTVHPNWQSFVGIPVMAGEKVHGAFGLFREVPTTFRPGEINFFKALAQVIRTAVQNARLFETLNHNREQLRRIARRVFFTQENERQRVSRELHDEAGQALTGLKIHLQMVLTMLKQMKPTLQSPVLAELEVGVETAVALCQTTLNHIRTIAHDLRPAALENLGLNAALQAFCRDFAHRTQLTITYTGQDSLDLPEAVQIGLYRFLQEALTNVARHAQAKTIEVQLQYDINTISLTVIDDGRGFDAPASLRNIPQKESIGLAGMKERIESVGGQLTITSELGQGTTLIAWIPL